VEGARLRLGLRCDEWVGLRRRIVLRVARLQSFQPRGALVERHLDGRASPFASRASASFINLKNRSSLNGSDTVLLVAATATITF